MCEFKSRLSQHFCLHMYCIFPYRTNQLRTDYVLHIESIILWIKICEIIVLTVLKSILNWVTPFTWQALLKINFKTVNTVSSQTFNHKIFINYATLRCYSRFNEFKTVNTVLLQTFNHKIYFEYGINKIELLAEKGLTGSICLSLSLNPFLSQTGQNCPFCYFTLSNAKRFYSSRESLWVIENG